MSDGTRLPTDILCDILCDQPISRLHFDKFSWAVGQVCKHWREVFLSYPASWSTLAFVPPFYVPSAGYIEEMDRRATYLERSAQRPLTLVVRVLGSTSNDYMTIWEILLSYSDRWKREKMPILESLAIVGRPYPPTQKYGTAFRTAPYLTELNLDVKDTEKRDVGKVDVSVNQAPHRPTQSRLR